MIAFQGPALLQSNNICVGRPKSCASGLTIAQVIFASILHLITIYDLLGILDLSNWIKSITYWLKDSPVIDPCE